MERRPRSRPRARSGRLAQPPPSGPLAHIARLIDGGGQITVGRLHPIACAAIATDGERCLAMLQRRSDENLQQLLERLDAAIARAWTDEVFTDEINTPGRPSRGC